MAYLGSASRRHTFESSMSTLPPDTATARCAMCGGLGKDTPTSPRDAWSICADMISARDSDIVKAWADQADGLVTFAALFSGVVTTFITTSYTSLQPDNQVLMVGLLRQISAQINGTAAPDASADTAIDPALIDVLQNALLFASLICSLFAAGMGVFYKEWLREYTLDMPADPRALVRMREHRFEGMEKWAMKDIMAAISIFLQLGVAFFIGAVVLFAWPLHPLVRLVLNVFATFWLVFWIGTACCPAVSDTCPYRSPLARLIFAGAYFWTAPVRILLSRGRWRNSRVSDLLGKREAMRVESEKTRLEVATMEYLFRQHWGDKRLEALATCIRQMDAETAHGLVERIVASRFPERPVESILQDTSQTEDGDLKRLGDIWRDGKGGRWRLQILEERPVARGSISEVPLDMA